MATHETKFAIGDPVALVSVKKKHDDRRTEYCITRGLYVDQIWIPSKMTTKPIRYSLGSGDGGVWHPGEWFGECDLIMDTDPVIMESVRKAINIDSVLDDTAPEGGI